MKTVPILFTFDASLELAAGVCITSLLENADPGLAVTFCIRTI